QQAAAGSVRLGPDEVSGWTEACGFPSGKELVYAIPAVKADAEAVGFQHPVDLLKGRLKPIAAVVVGNSSSLPIAVPHQVRRIGENEIDAARWQLRQDADTIATGNAIDELREVLH